MHAPDNHRIYAVAMSDDDSNPEGDAALAADKLPYFFGDFMQGNGIDQKKVPGVCWIEFRASQHAQWLCGSVNSWRPLLPSLHAIKASDPGGPCVYREVDETTGVWQCLNAASASDLAPQVVRSVSGT